MEDEAIHAGADSLFATQQKIVEKPQVKEEVTKNKSLARLADSDDWRVMVEEIDRLISHLKDLRAIGPTDTAESVGIRYLASVVAIDYLEDIKSLPERKKKINNKK